MDACVGGPRGGAALSLVASPGPARRRRARSWPVPAPPVLAAAAVVSVPFVDCRGGVGPSTAAEVNDPSAPTPGRGGTPHPIPCGEDGMHAASLASCHYVLFSEARGQTAEGLYRPIHVATFE